MRRKFLFLLFFLTIGAGLGFSHQIEINVSLNPAGSFIAKSSDLKIEGHLKKTESGFTAKKLTLDLSSLKTGLELRDEHMTQNYFEVKKFPKAILHEASGKSGFFQGKLEVHGVIHAISGKYQLLNKKMEITFPCKLSDFKIKEANWKGVGVEDEVEVKVELEV